MIKVTQVSKTFKVYKKDDGLKGAIKGLFKREKNYIHAVKNISFHVKKGEIIGYIGSNGAGKSTTIKMMTGVLTPSEGHIEVCGRVPHSNRIENAKGIGVVFGQRTQLWWDLPLQETFSILKEIYEVEDQAFKERYDYLIDLLEIEPFIKQPVRTLSLGQRMRADLAAAMLHSPEILYLDEPTIGLDVMVKERIRKAIKELNQKFKVTVILTTHDMSDIQELATRIMIIEQGEIIYDGSKEDINNKFGNRRQIDMKLEQGDELLMKHLSDYVSSRDKKASLSIDQGNLSIVFDQDCISVADIISETMSRFKVLDFSLKEQNIEDIVKKLYQGGVS